MTQKNMYTPIDAKVEAELNRIVTNRPYVLTLETSAQRADFFTNTEHPAKACALTIACLDSLVQALGPELGVQAAKQVIERMHARIAAFEKAGPT